MSPQDSRAGASVSTRRLPTASELAGLLVLGADATDQVTQVAEQLHRAIVGSIGLPVGAAPGRTAGIAGLVYRSVRGGAALVDAGGRALHRRAEPRADDGAALSWRAALNGVVGDRLLAQANPLALPMTLHDGGGRVLEASALSGERRLLLLMHGLCMHDGHWHQRSAARVPGGYGRLLQQQRGFTPIYLRYNSGLPIAVNGELLAALLDGWMPAQLEQLSVIAHSMGGLVMRSAIASAQQHALPWLHRLRQLVFLGTPHDGAALERLGHRFETLLGVSRYSAPFVRIGQLRSAGILDLRGGLAESCGWPEQARCHVVAAVRGRRSRRLPWPAEGDGLVPLRSALALGSGRVIRHFAPRDCRVLERCDHFALLDEPRVARQLLRWVSAAAH